MNWDSLDWKQKLGIQLGWQAGLGFVRASVLFTAFTVCAVLAVGVVLLLFWLTTGHFPGADQTLIFWVLSLVGAIGISLPFALFNGIFQGIWAAMTADQLSDLVIYQVLTGRAIILNVIGLPLLVMFFFLFATGDTGEAVSSALVALTATVPIGIVAYTSIPDVAEWYISSPYCPKRKRKSRHE